MAVSTPGWQRALLAKLGAPATPENLRFLNAWQKAEGGNASNNPFNTTQPAGGTSNYNSVGVKNYPSFGAGINATAQTLLNGRYNPIVSELRSGHASAQQEAQAVAASPWGTGSGVLRVLGAGGVSAHADPFSGQSPGSGAAGPQQGSGGLTGASPAGLRQMLAALMLQSGQQAVSGDMAGAGNSLMQMALARQQFGSAQQTFGPSPVTHGHGGPSVPTKALNGDISMQVGGKSPYSNLRFGSHVDWVHINPRLLKAVNQQAVSHGVVVDINSGYRSNKYSVDNGGFSGDPHTKGLAIDAYVNGQPIGAVIPASAWHKAGVRSGNVPNFYNGRPDPEHLDLLGG